MASQNRDGRQLMRQRGAGNRNVAPTDFELNFGVDAGRQDRQQMRQRGAANRRVDHVDFGLNFPTPGSRRSRSATPASRASNTSRLSKTLSRRSREPSFPRERRSASAATELEDLNPAKRPRLSAQLQINGDGADRNTSKRRQLSSVFPIIEDPEDEQPLPTVESDLDVSPAQRVVSPLFVPEDGFEKENAVPGEGKVAKKRKKRKSVVPAALRRKKRSSGASMISELRRSMSRQESVQLETERRKRNVQPGSIYQHPSLSPQLSIDVAEISDENSLTRPEKAPSSIGEFAQKSGPSQEAKPISKKPQKRRKKRKSVILVKPKKRQSLEGSTKTVAAGPSTLRVRSPSLAPLQDQPEDDHSLEEEDDNFIRPRRQAPKRPRRETIQSLATSPLMRRNADDGSEEEYNPDDSSPEPETPAPINHRNRGKHPTQPRSQAGKSLQNSHQRPPQKRKKETFPIVTHRMINTGALPTVLEEGALDANSDDEHQQAPISTIPDRPTPNSIDILAQICREVVSTAISRLPTTQPQDSSGERKRKRQALEGFGSELDSRLFDMSNAVENRLSLEARVRKAKREKSDLQARWIEVRSQRERMALKCDRVRRYHWDNEREREEKWEVSEAASRAELELARGGETEEGEEEDSLEFLLKSVAENVSGKGQMGLLDRIKLFNGKLERMAGVLEGRG